MGQLERRQRAAIEPAETEAAIDRRRLVRRAGAVAAGAGSLALAWTGTARPSPAAAAQEPAAEPTDDERARRRAERRARAAGQDGDAPAATGDADSLNLALSIEQVSASLLNGGLQAFSADALVAAGLPDTAPAELATMVEQDAAQAERLTNAVIDLGGTPVTAGAAPAIGDDPLAFLELAAALKETAVAAYATIANDLGDARQRATVLGIHSVEARHAARLQGWLGADAFPEAIDRPLARAEIDAALAAIAGGALPPPPAERQRDRAPEAGAATGGEATVGADEETAETAEQPEEAAEQPAREPRRVQDAPAADAEAEEDAARPTGPPPVQEIPIEGTTGGVDPAPAAAPGEVAATEDEETTPEAGEEQAGEAGGGAADDERFAAVIADAAAQLGVDPSTVQVVQAERTEWPDAGLGCPRPGEFYAQVVTPGYLVIVEANDTQLEYHTDRRVRSFVLCQ